MVLAISAVESAGWPDAMDAALLQVLRRLLRAAECPSLARGIAAKPTRG
jgi:hypothetical protein